MGELSQEIRPETAALEAGPSAIGLLSLVDSLWPAQASRGTTAGLPTSLVPILKGGAGDRHFPKVADQLDRAFPGWVEIAATTVSDAARGGLRPELQHLCILLARRPLREPEALLRALRSCPTDSRLWLLGALTGTDTAFVRESWLGCLRRWVASEDCQYSPSAWYAFARAIFGGWLNWEDFRECLVHGRMIAVAAGPNGYAPPLSRLGLWQHPVFSKWYRQAIYEVAHQPDARLSLHAAGWVQDFPGEEYLWAALEELERKPDSWWPFHVLRWVSVADAEGAAFAARLRSFTPLTLGILSLLRPDFCPAVESVFGVPGHAEVLRWLSTSKASASLDLRWVDATLRPWADAVGEHITVAAGALCSTDPPTDFGGPESAAPRRRAFLRDWLVPEFDRIMGNLFYLHALRKCHFSLILEQAESGTPAAIRALALWPEQAETSAPALFRLSRSGGKAARDAAIWALEVLGAHTGVADLAHLERRVDLASAWSDSGLEGKQVRAWWDVGGYHLRLSVDAGRVNVATYSGTQRLKSIPAAVRRDAQYQEIRQARADLGKSYRYFRRRFEQMMAEGVRYSGSDFAVLLANPVVRSLASRLVLSVDGAPSRWSAQDPIGDSPSLDGLAQAGSVGIAHPVELMAEGRLEEWQQRVIEERVGQPFKQIFREVYAPGEGEREARGCLRFAGHPLVARRAFALLRGRGYAPREGDAVKDWPGPRLRAHIEWASPEENPGKQLGADDASPVTSRAIWFEDGLGDELPLGSVAPVVFSETLRDADLLVSLAASGELGFTSEETRRLRATFVRYLARALGLTTLYVSEDDSHVIVDGKRAMYRVHLGSGSVLLEKSRRHLDLGTLRSAPLEALAVESLDTFTARILGIIGALSRDEDITDPDFLSQL